MKCLLAIAAITAISSAAWAQITIPTIPIGNPGNAADPFTDNLYGSVEYSYNIGSTEVCVNRFETPSQRI